MSVFATLAMWHPAHWATDASPANLSYGNGWWPNVKKPQPLVFANRLLSFTVMSIPLYSPLKNPRPEGSSRDAPGNVGETTRVNSFTMTVPSGKLPVFRYA